MGTTMMYEIEDEGIRCFLLFTRVSEVLSYVLTIVSCWLEEYSGIQLTLSQKRKYVTNSLKLSAGRVY